MPQLRTLNLIDLTLATLEENLALDEALLLAAEDSDGPEVLRFWEWSCHAVVLGAGGEMAKDVRIDDCQRDGVPILRRSSGGGTVLLGPGCLLFSLILFQGRDPALKLVNSSYRFILDRISDALIVDGTRPNLAGICDLAMGERKFSGNAQQRKQRAILHHGTILYDFDLDAVGRYLTLPDRRPDYRGDRTHQNFIINLSVDASSLRDRITQAWGATPSVIDLPWDMVARLVSEKYSQPEWNERK